jgi:hypothetical protein
MERRFYLCDASLPEPGVVAFSPVSASPGTRVTFEGENLSSVLDVVSSGQVFQDVRYISSTQTVEATVPPLPSGTHSMTFHSKTCANVVSSLSLTVP